MNKEHIGLPIILSGVNVFSLFEYRAYTDKDIFNKIESINKDSDKYNQDCFDSIIEELIKIYKGEIIFYSKYLRTVKYISYVRSTEKFNKINKDIVCVLAKKLGLEAIDICDYNNAKSDVRDAYINEENCIDIYLNNQYKNKPILFIIPNTINITRIKDVEANREYNNGRLCTFIILR